MLFHEDFRAKEIDALKQIFPHVSLLFHRVVFELPPFMDKSDIADYVALLTAVWATAICAASIPCPCTASWHSTILIGIGGWTMTVLLHKTSAMTYFVLCKRTTNFTVLPQQLRRKTNALRVFTMPWLTSYRSIPKSNLRFIRCGQRTWSSITTLKSPIKVFGPRKSTKRFLTS